MGYQDKCANGTQGMMAHMMLMSATVEEIHGVGTGTINGKKVDMQRDSYIIIEA